jgi:hypothetical protein
MLAAVDAKVHVSKSSMTTKRRARGMDTLALENVIPQNPKDDDNVAESLSSHMRSALLETKTSPKACYLELYMRQSTSIEEELSA